MLSGNIAQDPVESLLDIRHRQAAHLAGEPGNSVTQVCYHLKPNIRILEYKLFKLDPGETASQCILKTNGADRILLFIRKGVFTYEITTFSDVQGQTAAIFKNFFQFNAPTLYQKQFIEGSDWRNKISPFFLFLRAAAWINSDKSDSDRFSNNHNCPRHTAESSISSPAISLHKHPMNSPPVKSNHTHCLYFAPCMKMKLRTHQNRQYRSTLSILFSPKA